jgi:16S rRNA (guanine(527)-N(7))-methyltransferase RsmG
MEATDRFERLFRVSLSNYQKQQVELYLNLLGRWNRRINLTSHALTQEQLLGHIFEGFWAAANFLGGQECLVDVGSGAGFPGMTMKLYLPSLDLTLIEKSHKKTVFLKELSRQLELEVHFFQDWAENYPSWEANQIAILKALKPSSQLLASFSSRRLKLLCFHGQRLGRWAGELQVIRREKVPGSNNRYGCLLQC